MAPKQSNRSGARGAKNRDAPRDRAASRGEAKDHPGERIAKVIARAGVASRRDAEAMIADGRVTVDGATIDSPALNVTGAERITVDGRPLPRAERTRLWLYHKPKGLVTTAYDPEGRPTVFETLPRNLPRVLSIGRLDINTEGLLLLTNDGGLKRLLELPATGWLRRYKVRAYGHVEQPVLDRLRDGVEVDDVVYGPIEAEIERRQGDNTWLVVGIREGKRREVKEVLGHLGLDVNRLIRLSYGPFQLGELKEGDVEEVPRRLLREQLGPRLAAEAGVDFEGPSSADTVPRKARPHPPVARARRDEDRDEPRGRATAKAAAFAALQAGAADEILDMSEDDTPDVEIDENTGKIILKPKTVEDRKGRKVAVRKRFDPDRPVRERKPRVFGEDGAEMPERERPERPAPDERPRPASRERDGLRRPSTFRARDDSAPRRDDRRPSDRPREDRRDDDRPRRPFRPREETQERGERPYRPRRDEAPREERRRDDRGRDDRPRSFRDPEAKPRAFGYRDRGGPAGERGEGRGRSGGFRDRPEGGFRGRPRPEGEERGERGPYRPREDRPEGGERRPYRPREDRPEGGERRPYRPREDRPEGGERRPYRPREDRAEGGERKTYRPRNDRPEGGERRPYRPREDRAEGGERRPYRPREDRPEGGERRPYRPREDRAEGGERRPYRPREDRAEGGERRPYRPREDRPEGERRPFRPRTDRPERRDDDRRSGGGGFRPRGDRPERSEGDGPRRPYRPRGDRPERGDGDRPRGPYRPRGERGDDRPPRGGGERPGGGPRGPRKPRPPRE